MATEPRLTVISLEWDYGYRSIAVDRSPGFPAHLVRFLDPREVGLSDEVAERLKDWRVQKAELAARSEGDIPEEDIDDLRRTHRRLAEALHQLARCSS